MARNELVIIQLGEDNATCQAVARLTKTPFPHTIIVSRVSTTKEMEITV